ncbi:hypothetical protein FGB62_37g414 [Gracilaria domingensis]|nr:hypothetical protein FGB62_37g414 [Gracilaria domingensis]
MCAEVADKYCQSSKANDRPARDCESLKSIYDKLGLTKENTGDPSYHPDFRRLRHIDRDIQSKMGAMDVEEREKEQVEEGSEDNAGSSVMVEEKRKLDTRGNESKLGLGDEEGYS